LTYNKKEILENFSPTGLKKFDPVNGIFLKVNQSRTSKKGTMILLSIFIFYYSLGRWVNE
jgi:hypothetical protein